MTDERPAERDVLARALGLAARRAEIALRADASALDRLLGAIAEATVTLFDAEAASIALVEPGGALRFRAASGARGAGVVGTTVPPGEGIAGFVVATGQPIAISNVQADQRFDRATAERTGYVPRSILAMPLVVEDRVLGVLEVLDRRGRDGFDLRDQSLAAVFAAQAAVAIEVTGVERDATRLVARTLRQLALGDDHDPGAEADVDPTVDPVADAVARALEADEPEAGEAFWTFVDRLAGLAAADPARLALLSDLLAVAVAHLPSAGEYPGRGSGRLRPTWRDRAGVPDPEGDEDDGA